MSTQHGLSVVEDDEPGDITNIGDLFAAIVDAWLAEMFEEAYASEEYLDMILESDEDPWED